MTRLKPEGLKQLLQLYSIRISLLVLAFVWIAAAAVAAVALPPLGVWVAVEVQKDLPAFIGLMLIGYLAIKAFTPNPVGRRNGLIGLLWWETFEHLIYPAAVLGCTFLPIHGVEAVLAVILLYVVFGRLLGSVETRRDCFKLVLLINILLVLPSLPSLVLFFDYWYGLEGYVIWVIVCAATLTTYILYARKGDGEEMGGIV